MLLRVRHETHYQYSPAVETAQHQVHLRPLQTLAWQQLLEHQLEVWPRPDQYSPGHDNWGNARDFFALYQNHETLHVVADSLLLTRAPEPPHELSEESWESVRERYRYQSMSVVDEAIQFIFPSPYIGTSDALRDYAQASFVRGRSLIAGAQSLMSRIHQEFLYESQSTTVNTPLSQVLAQRKGVCQDFAHLMIACLRSLGLPARYVSGYLLTRPPPGQPRLIGSDASHAWVQVYVPPPPSSRPKHSARSEDAAGCWLDFDPTNNRRPADDYVWLAIGRDFADVSPIRGVLHGGASHQLKVKVTVAPPDDPSWSQLPAAPA